MPPLAPPITACVRERLPRQRGARVPTCESYASTLPRLLASGSQRLHRPPSEGCLAPLEAPRVMASLAPLEAERGPSPLPMPALHAMLAAPDVHTRPGIRDRAMLPLGFAAGLRGSARLTLPLTAVPFHPTPAIRVLGKGRRARS
jgi:hypothetical protein